MHAGSTPGGRKSARQEEVNELAKAIRVTPGQAAQGAMFAAAGEVAYVTTKVAELTEDEVFESTAIGHVLNPWLQLKHKAEDRLLRAAKIAADMGIDRARLEIAKAQTALMASFVQGVLGHLDLTPAQRKKVGPAVRKEIAVISQEGTEVG